MGLVLNIRAERQNAWRENASTGETSWLMGSTQSSRVQTVKDTV